MRLSADKDHPNYDASMLPCRVYLDDVEMKYSIHVDTDEGCFVCVAMDVDGHIILDGDEIRTEVICGAVRVDKMEQKCASIE